MSQRAWFFASEGKQQGPVQEAQLRELIVNGTVRHETLVWSDGMAGWQAAGEVPGLISVAGGPPPMSRPGSVPPGGPLSTEFGTFGLFGRALLMLIGILLIVPAPWVATMFYRWMIERTRAPQRPNLGFTGQPLDIWYVFVLLGLAGYAGAFADSFIVTIALIPVNAFLSWMTVRWITANISSDGQKLPLTFQGSPWMYIGWTLLMYVSMITIIGWAWVMTAWVRWIFANVSGTRRAVVFNASGWGVLWRTVVFVLACVVIIPIPWVLAWYARWYVSQIALVDRTVPAA
jgi:hypothetical protein